MNNKNWRIIGIVALALLCAAGIGFGYLVPRYQGTSATLSSTEAALATAQSDLASVQGQLSNVQSQLSNTQGELAGVQSELSDVSAELAVMQGKYPPRRFNSNLELESWLDDQPNPPSSADAVLWLRHALDMQQAAADDGFLISADQWTDDGVYYQVWCSAVLEDGSYYWWDPDTDDIYYSLDVNHF